MLSNTKTLISSYPALLCLASNCWYVHKNVAGTDLRTRLPRQKQTRYDFQFYVYCAQMELEKENRHAAVGVLPLALEI